jgi:hypothetical protein
MGYVLGYFVFLMLIHGVYTAWMIFAKKISSHYDTGEDIDFWTGLKRIIKITPFLPFIALIHPFPWILILYLYLLYLIFNGYFLGSDLIFTLVFLFGPILTHLLFKIQEKIIAIGIYHPKEKVKKDDHSYIKEWSKFIIFILVFGFIFGLESALNVVKGFGELIASVVFGILLLYLINLLYERFIK